MAGKGRMEVVTENGTRLDKLKDLALILARQIDGDDGSHSMAQLARQYRETIAEIDELEREEPDEDGIDAILG